MGRLETVWSFVKGAIFVFWGVNFIDWIPENDNPFGSIETTVQTLMSVAGLVFFLIKIPMEIIKYLDDRKGKRLDRMMKQEELKKLKKENEEPIKEAS
jgi:uncharacterized membrane protein